MQNIISYVIFGPDKLSFHGPAPLHHTLLSRCRTTGVTLQTLHPKFFDKGTIIAQTPFPGFEHRSRTVPELFAAVAPKGAEMLIQAIRNNTFVSPPEDKAESHNDKDMVLARPAPKITPKDREIDWDSWTAAEILLRHRIIGPLWNTIDCGNGWKHEGKRVIWSKGFKQIERKLLTKFTPGHMIVMTSESGDEATYVRTCDDQILQIESIKIAGGEEQSPSCAARRAGDLDARLPTGSDSPYQDPTSLASFSRPRHRIV